MPANFPEIWLGRVIQNLDNTDEAPFLEGIPELDVPITEINAGDLSEKNKIYVASTDFDVDVLLNNNTYPIPVQVYEDGTIEITLDKYQSKVTTLSDDQIIGSSYSKIDVVTKSHTRGIKSTKFKKAIHAIAPQSDSALTPVLEATGGPNNLTDPTGRKRLTYEDLVAAANRADAAGIKDGSRRLVLCSKHWNDLLLDRKNFGSQLVDYQKGKPSPIITGFEIQRYLGNPLFAQDGTKKAFGEVAVATDKQASVFFDTQAIAKKTGLTKQYFAPATNDPAHQTNRLNYRHYFIVTPFQARKIGAII